MDILAKRQLLAALRTKGRRRIILRKPGIIRYPALLENQYAALLMQYVDQLTTTVKNDIIPKLDLIVTEGKLNQPQIRKDDWTDRIEEVVTYGKEMFYKIGLPLTPVVGMTARNVNSWNFRQLMQATERALGAPLMMRDTFSASLTQGFIKQNVALIKNISDDAAKQIEQVIYTGVRNGDTSLQIANRILKKTDVGAGVMDKARTRAEFIARDQIGKLNGQLTMARQTEMGISRYRWRTMMDNRVRDDHKIREGHIFKWDKPPEGGHPGEDFNCRCYAEPMFEDILPELAE